MKNSDYLGSCLLTFAVVIHHEGFLVGRGVRAPPYLFVYPGTCIGKTGEKPETSLALLMPKSPLGRALGGL